MFDLLYIFCFLKASIILNVKVVPSDIFKFGGERVKCRQRVWKKITYYMTNSVADLGSM